MKKEQIERKLQSSSSTLSRLAEDEKNASESVESARKALNLAQSEVRYRRNKQKQSYLNLPRLNLVLMKQRYQLENLNWLARI